LGTVLGFYFGAADKLSVQQIEVAEPKFVGSDLLTHVSGGTGPFQYSISYPTQDTEKKITGLSLNGWIKVELTPPPAKAETISIEITDSKAQRLSKAFTKHN